MTDHGPGVRVPPPIMVAALVALGWGMARLVPLPIGAAPIAGLVVLSVGALIAAWTVAAMLGARTDPRPDKPDATLLESGPFRFSRNPIYLGFVLAAAGCALGWGDAWNWLAAGAAWLVLDRAVVAREETYLTHRFGAAYATYRGRVRRWV